MRKNIFIGLVLILLSTSTLFADRATAAENAIVASIHLENQGYSIKDIPGRHLRNNHYRTYNRYLYSGNCYAIVGVGDNNVRDLDVVVYDRYWNWVVSDRDSQSVSAVRICPRRSGTYRIRTTMYRGSGYFYQVIGWK